MRIIGLVSVASLPGTQGRSSPSNFAGDNITRTLAPLAPQQSGQTARGQLEGRPRSRPRAHRVRGTSFPNPLVPPPTIRSVLARALERASTDPRPSAPSEPKRPGWSERAGRKPALWSGPVSRRPPTGSPASTPGVAMFPDELLKRMTPRSFFSPWRRPGSQLPTPHLC
jgi:hypothetical protein